MTALLVGFDSAWTPTNSGALVGILQREDKTFHELGAPQSADFPEAQRVILAWQAEHAPTATLVLLDQPTIVRNATGQRPVENLVGSPVSLRYGGIQPANTGRAEMFGAGTRVFETYPVLVMIALGWTLPDLRPAGRLPKYNPERKRTFTLADWQHVCELASRAFRARGLMGITDWLDRVARKPSPRKNDQDGLDACLCLLVALHLVERKDCLIVGDQATGYIVVPDDARLRAELDDRCRQTERASSDWLRVFRLQ